MKLKTTKKAIRENSNNIIRLGYCEIQSLLNCQNPFAYSAGVYGWRCDYYEIDGVIISTGYSPIGKHVDYKTVKKYEKQAEKINCNYDLRWDTKKKKLNNLLHKFIEAVK